jgi:hypothetical protein
MKSSWHRHAFSVTPGQTYAYCELCKCIPTTFLAEAREMRDDALTKALEADGEKLRALTGKDHGPFCPHCLGSGIEEVHGSALEVLCGVCNGTGRAGK